MARSSNSKSNMAVDEKKLKKTFKTRLTSMKKKASELSIPCDIPVGIICYNDLDGTVETWTENHKELNDVISKYRSTDKKKKYKEQNVGVEQIDNQTEELRVLNQRKMWIDRELEAVNLRIRLLKEQRLSVPQFGNKEDDDQCREMGISNYLMQYFC